MLKELDNSLPVQSHLAGSADKRISIKKKRNKKISLETIFEDFKGR